MTLARQLVTRRLLLLSILLAMAAPLRADEEEVPPPVPPPPGVQWIDEQFISDKDGMKLAYVPAGAFSMGSANGHYSERPVHQVYLDDFLIDVHEVTNRQYAQFVEQSEYEPTGPWKRGFEPGQEDFPVRFVTWFDAKAYADWVGRTLPTEAMWEKAARGISGHVYPWGPTWKQRAAHTDLDIDTGPCRVGSYPNGASPYGCLDMGGNVWEWVNDWYDRFYYENFRSETLVRNPLGPEDHAPPEERFVRTGTAGGNERSTRKVIRGGGWVQSGKENLRCSKRSWGNPNYWLNDTGFRCAIPLQ